MDSYKQLTCWQAGVDLCVEVYRLTGRFPTTERYLLANQMRRAAVSVCANIAEGYGRQGPRELKRFLRIAIGSLSELDALIELARALGYLDATTIQPVREMRVKASKTAFGLLRKPGRT